jgi:transcriptional repressor NrdR
MRCPFCDADKESLKVVDSRCCDGGRSIRRRRKCVKCGKRFTTYERIEESVRLTVVKKSGDRVPYDREKLVRGLERACYKRPVTDEMMRLLIDEVEDEIFRSFDKEVPSNAIGQAVSERLRRLDQVAYVRFASVYKQFKTLDDLVNEAKAVLDARHYDDIPGQGRLFVEEHKGEAAAAPENGEPHPAAAGGAAPAERRVRRRKAVAEPPAPAQS